MRAILALIPFLLAGPALAFDPTPNLVDQTRPYAVPTAEEVLHERVPDLLRAALERPDAETRLEALVDARRLGITELAGDVAPLLADERPVVRTAVVQTLHRLGARETADRLAKIMNDAPRLTPVDRQLITTIDHALSDWGYLEAADRWSRRIADAEARLRLRISAAEALGRLMNAMAERAGPIGDDERSTLAEVADALAAIAGDRAAAPALRMASARARAAFGEPAVTTAQRLLNETTVDRLVAVAMLRHREPEVVGEMLRRAVLDRSPAVQAAALERLNVWVDAAELPIDLLARLADSNDPRVRELMAEGLVLHPGEAAVALLAGALADHHPAVRNRARASLTTLAATAGAGAAVRAALDERIPEVAGAIADDPTAGWREAEQLAILAGAIDHDPVAEGLLGFLPTSRTDTAVATWHAIRRLDVATVREPAIAEAEAALAYLAELARRADDAEGAGEEAYAAYVDASDRAAAAVMTMGAWRERRADAMLRKLVPKTAPATVTVRVAGVWALGMIYTGDPDDELARTLAGRLADSRGNDPEAFEVRLESAVTIGRMQSRAGLGALQRHDSSREPLSIRAACRWGVGNITGDAQPPFELEPQVIRETFIRPID